MITSKHGLNMVIWYDKILSNGRNGEKSSPNIKQVLNVELSSSCLGETSKE